MKNITLQDPVRFFFAPNIANRYNVLVPCMDSTLNMDTPNIFKGNTFYGHTALLVREESSLKR